MLTKCVNRDANSLPTSFLQYALLLPYRATIGGTLVRSSNGPTVHILICLVNSSFCWVIKYNLLVSTFQNSFCTLKCGQCHAHQSSYQRKCTERIYLKIIFLTYIPVSESTTIIRKFQMCLKNLNVLQTQQTCMLTNCLSCEGLHDQYLFMTNIFVHQSSFTILVLVVHRPICTNSCCMKSMKSMYKRN